MCRKNTQILSVQLNEMSQYQWCVEDIITRVPASCYQAGLAPRRWPLSQIFNILIHFYHPELCTNRTAWYVDLLTSCHQHHVCESCVHSIAMEFCVSALGGHLSCFHSGTTEKWFCGHSCTYLLVDMYAHFTGYVPRCGIAEYDWTLQIVPTNCSQYLNNLLKGKVPAASHPDQHLFSAVSLIKGILVKM